MGRRDARLPSYLVIQHTVDNSCISRYASFADLLIEINARLRNTRPSVHEESTSCVIVLLTLAPYPVLLSGMDQY